MIERKINIKIKSLIAVLITSGLFLMFGIFDTEVSAEDLNSLFKEYFESKEDVEKRLETQKEKDRWTSKIYNNLENTDNIGNDYSSGIIVFSLRQGYEAGIDERGYVYIIKDSQKITIIDEETNLKEMVGTRYQEFLLIIVIDDEPYLYSYRTRGLIRVKPETIALKVKEEWNGRKNYDYLCLCFVNGQVLKNGLFNDLYKTNLEGIYDFDKSELKKDILKYIRKNSKKTFSISIPRNYSEYFSVPDYNKVKDLKGMDFLYEIDPVYFEYGEITAILNRTIRLTIPIGGMIGKNLDKLSTEYKGEFITDKKGKKRYYCNEYIRKDFVDALVIYNGMNPDLHLRGKRDYLRPWCVSEKDFYKAYFNYCSMKYDIKTTKKNDFYLADTAALIEGDIYIFDSKGYVKTSQWIPIEDLPESFYDIDSIGNHYHHRSGIIAVCADKDGKLLHDTWRKKDGEWYFINSDCLITCNEWVLSRDGKKHQWCDNDGKVDTKRNQMEYTYYKKLYDYSQKIDPDKGVGICSVFATYLAKYLFGSNAKRKTYKCDWEKIKVGDYISLDTAWSGTTEGHDAIVYIKNNDYISFADSNRDWDGLPYFDEHGISREEFEEIAPGGHITLYTYY